MGLEAIIIGAVAAVVGAVLGFFAKKSSEKPKLEAADRKADEVITTARLKAKDIQAEAEKKNESISERKLVKQRINFLA
jgi:gas vesicle protein